jgi:hypothetical protein
MSLRTSLSGWRRLEGKTRSLARRFRCLLICPVYHRGLLVEDSDHRLVMLLCLQGSKRGKERKAGPDQRDVVASCARSDHHWGRVRTGWCHVRRRGWPTALDLQQGEESRDFCPTDKELSSIGVILNRHV